MAVTTELRLGFPSERERMIAAVARCCETEGYGALSIEQVIAEAGVRREDFERHFFDLESCAKAAVEAILAESMTAISANYSSDASEWTRVLRVLEGLLELFAARPALSRMAFIETRQSMPQALHDLYRSGFTLLSSMLDRLRGDQVGVCPPKSAARAAIGAGEALVRRELVAGRAAQLPQLLPDLVYSATIPFLGSEEAARLMGEAALHLEGRRGRRAGGSP